MAPDNSVRSRNVQNILCKLHFYSYRGEPIIVGNRVLGKSERARPPQSWPDFLPTAQGFAHFARLHFSFPAQHSICFLLPRIILISMAQKLNNPTEVWTDGLKIPKKRPSSSAWLFFVSLFTTQLDIGCFSYDKSWPLFLSCLGFLQLRI